MGVTVFACIRVYLRDRFHFHCSLSLFTFTVLPFTCLQIVQVSNYDSTWAMTLIGMLYLFRFLCMFTCLKVVQVSECGSTCALNFFGMLKLLVFVLYVSLFSLSLILSFTCLKTVQVRMTMTLPVN